MPLCQDIEFGTFLKLFHSSKAKDFFSHLDHALEDSQRLTSIFDELLRITQIESGARRSRFTRIDLAQIVDTVTEIYQDLAEGGGDQRSW
ncbi:MULTISPECIES: hypothetical protein [Gammaproteobacteria]|uniref:hypothetical protein n=1 Tax=Gammaproteobacteria TaxID=1236 RepID=UPI001ADACA6E|nr:MULTISPECIES: hypothetical protein [Gammaproteobacteria]MBO9480928.1 hypothetical protein [Salinisphaera sp. G21_0]MBO9494533.1 hypothetical protein [Thalassotalea sp. G20_0]